MGGFYGASVSTDDDPEVQNLLAQLQEESILQLSVGTHRQAGLKAPSGPLVDEDTMEGLDSHLLERFAKLKSNPSGSGKGKASVASGEQSSTLEGKDAALEQETKSRNASIPELDDRLARLKMAPSQPSKSASLSSGAPTSQRFSPMKLIKQLSMGKKSSSSKVKTRQITEAEEGGDTNSQSDTSKLLAAVMDEVKLEKQQKNKNSKKASLTDEEEDVDLDLELKDLDVRKLKRELSKASTEEEKLAREAQKVVEWAKDAARLDLTPDSDDEDDELLQEGEDEDEDEEGEEHEHKSKSSKQKKKGKRWGLF